MMFFWLVVLVVVMYMVSSAGSQQFKISDAIRNLLKIVMWVLIGYLVFYAISLLFPRGRMGMMGGRHHGRGMNAVLMGNWWIIPVLVIGGLAVYVITSKGSKDKPSEDKVEENNETLSSTDEEIEKMNIKDL